MKRVHWQNHHLNHLNFSHWQIDQKTKTREFSSVASHCMMMGAQPNIHLKRPLQCKPWKLEAYHCYNTAVIRVALDVMCIITTDNSVQFLEL